MYGKGKVVIIESKTTNELGVDLGSLRSGSHTKIFVQCQRCREEFKREFRNLHQLHNCPNHRTIDGIRQKWCNKGKHFQPLDRFDQNQARYDGLASQCVACRQDVGTSTARVSRLRHLRSTFDGWLKRLTIQKRSQTRKDAIAFDLTFDYLRELWHTQGGMCFYSKIPLRFNSTSLYGAQIDRIIPSKGYVIGNVVWASKGLNNLKSNSTLNEFVEFFQLIAFQLPVRCEFKKLDPRARMPQRAKATDAGLDVYALENAAIGPEEVKILDTGLALVVPPNYYYTIEGRSSSWKHGIVPCRGIIDATYSGQLKIAICNHHPNDSYIINAGDRIAQLIMHRFVQADITEVTSIDDIYSESRGDAGFGSTGR